MRRAVWLVAAAVALSVPAADADSGQVRHVSIPGQAYAPAQLDVLVGDTVTWENGDSTNHTVTSNDGSFDSGYLAPGASFSQVFPKLGRYEYHCTIHRFMHGVVVVVPVAFQGPTGAVASGSRVTLSGLAPAGSGVVSVEKLGGPEPNIVRKLTPAGDGSFSITVTTVRPARFTAAIKGRRSVPVTVVVSPRVRASLGAQAVEARVSPPRPDARAALQVYVPEHFSWQTIERGRVSGGSRVSLALPHGAHGHYRVIVRGGSGWSDGASQAILVQ